MASYQAVYGPLNLGPAHATASARLEVKTFRDVPYLHLRFKTIVAGPFSALEDSPSALGIPPNFDKDIDNTRVARAICWALDLNAVLARRFEAGEEAVVRVPLCQPNPLPRPQVPQGISFYRREARSSGELIRPLFLSLESDRRLYPYQEDGVQWLLQTRKGILADDMGLGKTVQALVALNKLIHQGNLRTCLVLCPQSLLAMWEAELDGWAPSLSRLRVTTTSKARNEAWASIWGRVHVHLTNYEQLRDPPPVLLRRAPDLIIADEAHRIRNFSSLVTKGVRRLRAPWFWALTGTPIERDEDDLATLLSTINPSRYARTLSRLSASAIRAQTKDCLLRRSKKAVLRQLPPVIEIVEELDLLPKQRVAYRNVLSERLNSSLGLAHWLQVINDLRTICDYDVDSLASAKADRIMEILAEVKNAGEKAVVFSYLLEPLRILKSRLCEAQGFEGGILEGSLNMLEREQLLADFRKNDRTYALLASSRLAGEGLTLTEANHVVFFNEWWNPSANKQARDRVVRIGQRRGVYVYKFVCRGTIEETLQEILRRKSETFSSVIEKLSDPQMVTRELARALAETEG